MKRIIFQMAVVFIISLSGCKKDCSCPPLPFQSDIIGTWREDSYYFDIGNGKVSLNPVKVMNGGTVEFLSDMTYKNVDKNCAGQFNRINNNELKLTGKCLIAYNDSTLFFKISDNGDTLTAYGQFCIEGCGVNFVKTKN